MIRFVAIALLQAVALWGCSQEGSTGSSAVTDKSTTTATKVATPAVTKTDEAGQPVEEPTAESFLITYPPEFVNLAAFAATWAPAPKVVDYDFIIAADGQCKVPLQSYGDLKSLEQQIKALPEGQYYVCVYAIQEKGKLLEAANSPFAFTVDLTPPDAPALQDVSANGFTNNNTPLIGWTPASGHDYYDLTIASGASCDTAEQSYANLDGALTSQAVRSALSDGSYVLCLTARDKAGNKTVASNNALPFTVDTVAPQVTTLSATTADGTYKAGDNIVLTLTFSEIVEVDTTGGTPTLKLETGATDHAASYASGSGTETLTFTYTVQAGDTSADLDALAGTDQITFNGGTIRDRALNDVVATVPVAATSGSLAGNKAIVLDTTAPRVASVTSPNANGYYKTGDTIDITVTFDEPVAVTDGAAMAILLETGASDRNALYQSGSGSATLTFRYQVQTGDLSSDLGTNVTNVITLNGATLKDLVGNNAVLTLPPSPASVTLAGSKAIVADGQAPTISQITSPTGNGYFKAGGSIVIRVVFNETVVVTNGAGLQITLETGASDAVVMYGSGSGSTALLFPYTVAPGHTSTRLAVHSDGIALNGATIKDLAGNAANLTLPAPASSLANLKNLRVDTTAPIVASVSATSADGSYKLGHVVTLTVTFDEIVNVTNGSSVKLNLDTGAQAVYASGSGSATWTFNYTVGAGETSADLDMASLVIAPTGIIRDLALNDASLNLPATRLKDVKAIVIDAIPPGAFGITGPSAMTYTTAQTAAWDVAADAVAYDLVVSTVNNCNAPVHAPGSPYTGLAGTTQALALPDGVYYLCVTAKDALGNTTLASNQPWGFEVETSVVNVSYTTLDAGTYTLKHGKWASGSVTSSLIDSDAVNVIATHSALALDSNDKVHVSYAKGSGGDYEWRYAQNTSGVFVSETATAGANIQDSVGLSSAIALSSDDTVHMVGRYDYDDGVLAEKRLAELTGTAGSFGSSLVQSDASLIFQDQSLALDSADVAHLLQTANDGVTYTLRYRNNAGGGWGSGADTLLGDPGCAAYLYASLALSSADKVHGVTLCVTPAGACRVDHVTNATGSWVYTPIGTVASAGCSAASVTDRDRPTILLDVNDKAHIVYFDEENAKLMYAQNGSGSFVSTMISLGVGWQPTIARDEAGKLYVFYLTTAAGEADLRLLHNNSGSWSTVDIDTSGHVMGIGDAAVSGVAGRSNR